MAGNRKKKRGVPKTIRYRELKRMLRRGGAVLMRERGSHRIWALDVPGSNKPIEFPIPAHNDGQQVRPIYIKRLREVWKIDKAHGVSDEAFFDSDWKRHVDAPDEQ